MNPRLRRAMIGNPKYRDYVMSLGPVGYWRLAEASGTVANDETGIYGGTYAGAPTLGVAGLLSGDPNTAVTLNGSTQYMQAASLASLDARTLAIWCSGSVNQDEYLFYAGANNYLRRQGTTNNRLVFAFRDATPTTLYFIGPTNSFPADGATRLAVVTHDGTAARCYINGVLSGTPLASTLSATGVLTWNIGSTASADFWDGTLDEPAIFPRALTPDEIAKLYQLGRGF